MERFARVEPDPEKASAANRELDLFRVLMAMRESRRMVEYKSSSPKSRRVDLVCAASIASISLGLSLLPKKSSPVLARERGPSSEPIELAPRMFGRRGIPEIPGEDVDAAP